MDATPTLLNGVQIASRLARVTEVDAAAIATAAPAVSPAPIARIARARNVPDVLAAFALVPRPVPAAVRIFSYLNFQ